MGIPYFTTFIYKYLFSNKHRFKPVNLTKTNVIIDGYSLFYFTYYMIKREDKGKSITEQLTTTKFAYDGLSERFRSILTQFKDNCANVKVVFDGSFESNKHQRSDPKRDSTVQFNDSRSRLPPLLHDQLMSILHDLSIEVHIAPGEADPMIVQMARNHDAYIIARDSDYFLYEATKGYVPLDTLEFSTLEGEYYYMQDVFPDMTQRGVALWATTIIYEFIKLDVLQREFEMANAHDAEQFRCWLDDSKSDNVKHQRLTCQYNMLRYIQQVGHIKAFNKIISLIEKEEEKELFEKLMENYIHMPLATRKLTPNGNEIHPYLNEMYINGKLDPDVINILVRRQILYLWKGSHPIHLRLLTPMCCILIKWDHSKSNDANHPPSVTFNGQAYNPLQMGESDHLPSLDQMQDHNPDAKRFVLGCVNFALEKKSNWHGIHKDNKLWLCLLKLWLHTKTEYSKSFKMTLVALIISFLKHVLLDTYRETEERSPRSEAPLEKPYRQHSHEKLKSFFTRKQCYDLREGIKRYTQTFLTNAAESNEEIEGELQECQQFYKELSMINQFWKKPFKMPPPDVCFSQFTYPLAVRLSQSKNFRKDIRNFCSGNELLIDCIKELYAFFVPSIPSSTE